MPAPRWSFDTGSWPIVVVSLPERPTEPPDIEAFLRDADTILARGERLVVVYDLRFANPDARRRRRVVEWMRSNIELSKRLVIGMAIVAPGPFQRSLIVAFQWFVNPVIPMAVFGDLRSAVDWAQQRARADGLKV